MPLKVRSWRSAVPVAAVFLLLLTACAPAVSVDQAKDANNPACASMMVALPDALADAKLRTTSSQATAAWGDPSVVILRCGVTVPGLTTYGRDPATELMLSKNKVPSDTVLTEISAAASKIPASGGCLGLGDVPNPTQSPTPQPSAG